MIRFIRSNRRLDLFGKKIILPEQHAYTYVTAIIKVRYKRLIVVTLNGEIIHDTDFELSRTLR